MSKKRRMLSITVSSTDEGELSISTTITSGFEGALQTLESSQQRQLAGLIGSEIFKEFGRLTTSKPKSKKSRYSWVQPGVKAVYMRMGLFRVPCEIRSLPAKATNGLLVAKVFVPTENRDLYVCCKDLKLEEA